MTVSERICQLVNYGVEKKLIGENDRIYTTNRILEVLRLDAYELEAGSGEKPLMAIAPLEEVLDDLVADAVSRGVIEDQGITGHDLFDTKLMACLVPPPSQVIEKFWNCYEQSPEKATDFYYQFSQDTDYIRRYRIKKDLKWTTHTPYGDLDLTINLSKPEKDPKTIAAALKTSPSRYPKCLLCRENEGYAGRLNHPARGNHRLVPLKLNGETWYMQYSPYVYYNEHCIVLNGRHTPMKINRSTFVKLFDFIKVFPHYFVGSNADLPIVGGSILTHDHFQGGRYKFAMEMAPVERPVVFEGFEDIRAGIVKWPMSVVRLAGGDCERLTDLADRILSAWREYTDESVNIYARTHGQPHNTITPIARMRGGEFELDLVLRNNMTTPEYPDGIYHPHQEYHHVKKENIGLIEVMGLAVLPARLNDEIALLKKFLLEGKDVAGEEKIVKHAQWAARLKENYPKMDDENIDGILQNEIGQIYAAILEQCGVFKRNDRGQQAFDAFIETVNQA